jgi:hypothetical protein
MAMTSTASPAAAARYVLTAASLGVALSTDLSFRVAKSPVNSNVPKMPTWCQDAIVSAADGAVAPLCRGGQTA